MIAIVSLLVDRNCRSSGENMGGIAYALAADAVAGPNVSWHVVCDPGCSPLIVQLDELEIAHEC